MYGASIIVAWWCHVVCCLMAPSHYLNQCWLILKWVLWHSIWGISPENNNLGFKTIIWKLMPHLPGANTINLRVTSSFFLAVTKQLYEWSFPSFWMSVCLSVCLSHLFDYVPIIVSSWNFQELLPMTKSDVHAKAQGQRSKVKVTEVNSQLSRFRTVTPVWIQISWWNDAQSLMLLRRGSLLFFKVIRQISRSHKSKNRRIWRRLGISGLLLQFKFTNGYEMMHKAWSSIEEVPYCFSRSSVKFQGHTALKIVEFDPDWGFPDCNSSLNTPMATKWCTNLK